MKNPVLVSVIIATYNRSDFIEKCLDSVFCQTIDNIQVVLVNDCSTDNTESVVEELRATKYKDKNIVYIANRRNRGVAYNSNIGYQNCSGKYIALLGDDDAWTDPEKLEKQLAEFEKDQTIGLVGTHWVDVVEDKITKSHSPTIPHNIEERILTRNGVYCGSSVLISRLAWDEIQGFDINIPKGTDSDLFRRIVLAGYNTSILPENCVKVNVGGHKRMSPTNSISSLERDITSNELCLLKFKEQFKQYPKAKSFRKQKIIKNHIKLIVRFKQFGNVKTLLRSLLL